ncbi:MAG: copper resistance protein B [Steroidobacteraceae bacterium]
MFAAIALFAPRLLWSQAYPDQHVAPAAPQNPMPAMSYGEMARLMRMDDTEATGMVLLDELEWRDTSAGAAAAWLGEGWYGGDYDKLWVRSEGEQGAGTETARIEAFWDRIVSRWWSVQAGARQDFTGGPSRTWAALGLQGRAPCWLNVQATLYVGDSGRAAARLWTSYALLLTQRLILEPELEANLYGKSDPARHLGSGLSDLDAGLRLRYEFRREFAPYVGVVWQRFFGGTADQARALGDRVSEAQFMAGVRVWF